MSEAIWDAVDAYFADALIAPDAGLEHALSASEAAGLPPIAVAPNQGKLLYLLAKTAGARRILEIGALGGYSTIWLARSLPAGGKVISLELDPHHAQTARANLYAAGLSDRSEVRLGRGVDLLPQLEREGGAPFDLVFIDADKPSNPDYFAWALKLTRPGSLIVVDNVVRGGKVIDADGRDPNVEGVRKLTAMLATEPRVEATALQTVGSKGYDGLILARVP